MNTDICPTFVPPTVPASKPKVTREAKLGGGTVRMSEGVKITVNGKPLKTKKIKTKKPKAKK